MRRLTCSNHQLFQHRKLQYEQLEERRLLAAESYFAKLDGEVTSGFTSGIPIIFRNEDFSFNEQRALVEFRILAAEESALNALPPFLADSSGTPLLPLAVADDDLAATASSTYSVTYGDYILFVGGEYGSAGAFEIEVSLLADVDNTQDVSGADFLIWQRNKSDKSAGPSDFNNDGLANASDLLNWANGYGLQGNASKSDGDSDQDRDTDGSDFLVWQRGSGTSFTEVTGDFDDNGFIEAADLTDWIDGYGLANGASQAEGDSDGGGDVDGFDFLVWQQQFGTSTSDPILGDADGNRDVDQTDLQIILGDYGSATKIRPLTLSLELSEPLESNAGAIVVEDPSVSLFGSTLPGFEVGFDTDGDGSFDDEMIVADSSGRFSIQPTLAFGENTVRARVSDSFGQVRETSLRFTLERPPFSISRVAPAAGEKDARLTRDIRVELSEAVDPATVSGDTFHVIAGGQRVAGTLLVGRDGKSISLFPDEPLPASTRARIIIDGDSITNLQGRALDANGDEADGGAGQFEFTTVGLTRIAGTSISGFVYDSTSSTETLKVPIVGLTLRVEGLPELTAVTDADGAFTLQDTPGSEFFVTLDASTATNAPAGFAYVGTTKPFHPVPGKAMTLKKGGQPFDIFLPLAKDGDAISITPGEMTMAAFSETTLDNLQQITPDIAREEWEKLAVEIPPDSLFFDDGSPASEVQIFALAVNRIPAPVPQGFDPAIVFSVDAGGAENFDVPAKITYPNVDGLAPGEKRFIYSFDHDGGEWVPTGTMTVSSDGSVLVSDDGVQTVGWRFIAPEPQDEADPEPGKPEILNVTNRLAVVGSGETYLDIHVHVPKPRDENGNPVTAGASVKKARIDIDRLFVGGDAEAGFDFGDAKLAEIRSADGVQLLAQPNEDLGVFKSATFEGLSFGSYVLRLTGVGVPDEKTGFDNIDVDFSVTYLIGGDERSEEADKFKTSIVSDPKPIGPFEWLPFSRPFVFGDGYGTPIPSQGSIDELAEFFAPVVHLSPGEQYFPIVVEDSIAAAWQFEDGNNQAVSLTDSQPISSSGGLSRLTPQLVAGQARRDVAIDYVPRPRSNVNLVDEVSGAREGLYYSTLYDDQDTSSLNDDRFAITYWLHYAMSNWRDFDGFNNHEGDWESITIFLEYDARSRLFQPETVSYAQHVQGNLAKRTLFTELRGGETVSWHSAHFSKSEQQSIPGPSIFVGLGGHASYPLPGVSEWSDVNDIGLGTNLEVHTGAIDSALKLTPTDYSLLPLSDMQWSTYPGKWGEFDTPNEGLNVIGRFLVGKDGPHSPRFSSDGRYYDPWAWANRLKSRQAQLAGVTQGIDFLEDESKTLDFVVDLSEDFLLGPRTSGRVPVELQFEFAFGSQTQYSLQGAVLQLSDRNGKEFGQFSLQPNGPYSKVELSELPVGTYSASLIGITRIGSFSSELSIRLLTRESVFGGANDLQDTLKIGLEAVSSRAQSVGEELIQDTESFAKLVVLEQDDVRLSVDSNNAGGVVTGQSLIQIASLTNDTQNPITLLSAAFNDADPFAVVGVSTPLVIESGQAANVPVVFQPSRQGLQRGTLRVQTDRLTAGSFEMTFVGTGLPSVGGGVAEIGDDFVTIVTPENPAKPVERLLSNELGSFRTTIASNQALTYQVFDPSTGLIGATSTSSSSPGGRTLLQEPVFKASVADDTDFDGLPDDIEFTIGTDLNKRDSDDDGLDDFTEIAQGLNPLDGVTSPLGIVGSVSPNGETRDVVLAGSVTDSGALTAYLATGTYGLAIVDVTQFSSPIVLSEIDLPGVALGVDVDENSGIAVIAAGSEGLHFIDISDPLTPIAIGSITDLGTVERVEIYNGLIFTNGQHFSVIDVVTREIIQQVDLGANIRDLSRDGDLFAVTTSDDVLHVIDVSSGSAVARSSLPLTDRAFRVFLGGGIAYVSNNATNDLRGTPSGIGAVLGTGGYSTVSVANPDAPEELSGVDTPNVASGNFRTVTNGSGVALVAGGPLRGVQVHDAEDNRQTYNLLNEFLTPGTAESVAIGSGIAFVADGAAGLQILNYREFDTGDQAPEITIDTDVIDTMPGRPGIQVVEGRIVRVNPTISDDVQVESAELLLDGVVIRSDVTFPFDLSLTAPKIPAGSSTATIELQARAIDTGGNSALSDSIFVEIVPDTVPPTVTQFDLLLGDDDLSTPGIQLIEGSRLRARFSSTDDGSVQSVELLRNGVAVESQDRPSGVFSYTTEGLQGMVSRSVGMQLRVTDVAGNTTTTPPQRFDVVPDTFGPTITEINVVAGEVRPLGISIFRIAFSEPVAVEGLIASNFRLFGPGGEEISTDNLVVAADNQFVQVQYNLATDGNYVFSIAAPSILDLAGNPLAQSQIDFGFTAQDQEGPLFPGQTFLATRADASTVADFNGDGILDIATADSEFERISLLLGDENGGFLPEVTFRVGAVTFDNPADIDSADLDGDGDIDIVTAGEQGFVSVILNDGNGSFGPHTTYSVGGGGTSLTLRDFNGDTRPDVAIVSSDKVSVLLNNGDASLGLPDNYAVTDATAVRSGDIDGDGLLDLVTSNRTSNDISVLLGSGGGAFGAEQRFTISLFPLTLSIGDLNEDGALDILSGGGSSDLSVLFGNGSGGFDDEVLIPLETGVRSLELDDIDGNGHLDIIAGLFPSSSSGIVAVLQGDGTGAFFSQQEIPLSRDVRDLEVADFNRDGVKDIATVSGFDVSVFFGTALDLNGNGNADVLFPQQALFDVGNDPRFVINADFNGDGHLDLATANFVSDDISVLLGDGFGGFPAKQAYPAGMAPHGIVASDFDGDGILDIASANWRDDTVTVLLGEAGGAFVAGQTFPVGDQPSVLAAADFDRDGIIDLAVANQRDANLSILIGDGDGSFSPGQSIAGGTFAVAIATGDFNGDGFADIVTNNNDSRRRLSVFLGDGDGSFQEQRNVLIGLSPGGVATGDFNNDGLTDIAAVDNGIASQGTLSVILGSGDGLLSVDEEYVIPFRAAAITTGDFNGDGVIDVGAAGEASAAVFLGDGMGRFEEGQAFVAGRSPASVTSGDYNGDGLSDLATANRGGNDISVLMKGGVIFLNIDPIPELFNQERVVTDETGLRNSGTAAIVESAEIAQSDLFSFPFPHLHSTHDGRERTPKVTSENSLRPLKVSFVEQFFQTYRPGKNIPFALEEVVALRTSDEAETDEDFLHILEKAFEQEFAHH